MQRQQRCGFAVIKPNCTLNFQNLTGNPWIFVQWKICHHPRKGREKDADKDEKGMGEKMQTNGNRKGGAGIGPLYEIPDIPLSQTVPQFLLPSFPSHAFRWHCQPTCTTAECTEFGAAYRKRSPRRRGYISIRSHHNQSRCEWVWFSVRATEGGYESAAELPSGRLLLRLFLEPLAFLLLFREELSLILYARLEVSEMLLQQVAVLRAC